MEISVRKIQAYGFVTLLVLIGFFAFIPATHAATLKLPPNYSGLVGMWTFEDATGTIATDFSGNGGPGILTSTGTLPQWGDGKHGKALEFDGTEDYVVVSDTAPVSLAGNFTLSAWIKTDSSSKQQGIIEKYTCSACAWGLGGYGLRLTSAGKLLAFTMDNSDTATPLSTGNTTVSTGVWHHVAVIYNGTTLKVYLNGVEDGTANSTRTPTNGAATLKIGARGDDASNRFDGFIDDVRIYSRALSVAELSNLYNAGATRVKAQNTSVLAGYWSLNEATGTSAGDFSGNGNNGTLISMEQSDWVSGKHGSALEFDGAAEYVDIGITSVGELENDFTLAAWVKPTAISGTQRIVGTSRLNTGANGYGFALLSTGGLRFTTFGVKDYDTSDGLVGAGTWQHVAVVFDTSNDAHFYVNGAFQETITGASSATQNTDDGVLIGAMIESGPSFVEGFAGQIDEVRVYSDALSAAQISGLYGQGAARIKTPNTSGMVGYWKLDENTGTQAGDSSGYGNTGVITGASWAAGKFGKALSFDGSNDVVVTGSSLDASVYGTNARTISVWFNANVFSTGTDDKILTLATSTTNGRALTIQAEDNGVAIGFTGHRVICGKNTLATGTWYHFALSIAADSASGDSGVICYINGAVATKATEAGSSQTINSDPNLFSLGGGPDNTDPFSGSIDEVRIWNRVLSATEIEALYDLGT